MSGDAVSKTAPELAGRAGPDPRTARTHSGAASIGSPSDPAAAALTGHLDGRAQQDRGDATAPACGGAIAPSCGRSGSGPAAASAA
jgi:hypothetical protein